MMRNRLISTKMLATMLLLVAGSSSANENSPDLPRYLHESRAIAQRFMQQLATTLKSELAAGGPEKAIRVCQHAAPALAAAHSKDGWVVKRVSLKPRNSTLGVADAWERSELERFDAQYRAGDTAAEMESSAVVESADGHWFRYVKAIPTQAMCLSCHGPQDDLAPAVQKVLQETYPSDQATGYQVGEIRGAVSIKRRIASGE